MSTVVINEYPVKSQLEGWMITGNTQEIRIYKVVREFYERQDAPCYQDLERTYLHTTLTPSSTGYRKALMALWNQIDAVQQIEEAKEALLESVDNN